MSARRRRKGQWFYRRWLQLPAGKVRIFGTPGPLGFPNTKIGAELAEAQHVAETLRTGNPRPFDKRIIPTRSQTVNAFSKTFLDSSEVSDKYSSLLSKRQILTDHVLPAVGHLGLDAVSYATFEDLKIALSKNGLGPKTINNVIAVLRRLLVIAHKRGLAPAPPDVDWLPVPEQPFDFLDFDEADRLLAAAERDPEWHAMILVGLRAGLRQGELLGLRWDDVDLTAGRLLVQHAIVRGRATNTKGKRSREIPLGDDLIAVLKSHRHLRGMYVFCQPDGVPWTVATCRNPLARARKRAGLRHFSWHTLRHTFASHLVMRGAPLKVVQELLGHRTIQMTMRYAHLAPHVARDAVRLLDAGHPVPAGDTREHNQTRAAVTRPRKLP